MLTNCQINNFQLTRQIGSGAYGLVFHAVDVITENEYAVKAVMKNQAASTSASAANNDIKKSAVLQTQLYHYFKSFENRLFLPSINLDSIRGLGEEQLMRSPHFREIAMHLRVHSHPNVVTVHQVLESPLATFLVMDYYPRDLFTSIVDDQHFAHDGQLIKKVFLQLCSVLKHCHDRGVYHCDIKPENILLDGDDNAFLCDFGLSTLSTHLPANVCVGSSYYMAPERISCPTSLRSTEDNQGFPSASGDVWSLGIILINLTCIRNPWLKAHQLEDNTFHYFVKDPKVLMKILPVSQDLYQLLADILRLDPYSRISLESLMERVSACTRFTSSGPLSQVEALTEEQVHEFIIGNRGMEMKKMLYDYHSEDEEEAEDVEDDTEYSSEEESYRQLSSVDTTPNGSVDVDHVHVGVKQPKRILPDDFKSRYLQLNLSTVTNYSSQGRWLPQY